MSDKIKFKRGLKRAMPQTADIGEPLYCTDTNELYIGTGTGIQRLATVKTIDCGYFEDNIFEETENTHYDGGTF